MIKIKLKNENDVNIPERELTKKEKETVTSTVFSEKFVIYYQGDEPMQG